MALDRGMLAKIDRRVFAELDHGHGVQAVKVPVSDAVWSTWRRYCEAMGLSMGEGVAWIILDELRTLVDVDNLNAAVFAEQITQQTDERAAQLDARQDQLASQAEALRKKEDHLRAWERRLRTPRMAVGRTQIDAKVGRHERCPCGSRLKHEHWHGLPGRSR